MGFFGSLLSGISSACSAISSAVSGFVSNLAPAITAMGAKLNTAFTVISIVIKVVGILANILKPEDDIEDIGEKTLQAEEHGITLDSCNNDFEEYSKKIREFTIDPDEVHSPVDRLAAGILFVQNGIEIKYPYIQMGSLYPLIIMNSQYFNKDRIATYFNLATELKYNFEDLARFYSGTCSAEDAKTTSDFITKAERKLNPDISSADVQKQNDAIKREVYEKL